MPSYPSINQARKIGYALHITLGKLACNQSFSRADKACNLFIQIRMNEKQKKFGLNHLLQLACLVDLDKYDASASCR